LSSTVLEQWKNDNGLSFKEGYVYGNYNGVGFAVNEEGGGSLFVITLLSDNEAAYKALQKEADRAGGALKGAQVGKVEEYLALFVPTLASGTAASEIVDFAISSAKEAGFEEPQACVKCGASPIKLRFEDGIVRPICEQCRRNNLAAKTAPATEEGNSFLDSIDDDAYSGANYQIGRSKENVSSYYNNETVAAPAGNSSFGAGWTDQRQITNDDNYDSPLDDDSFSYGSREGSRGNVFTGILGALLGAAIGVVPYILIYQLLFFNNSGLNNSGFCLPAGALAIVGYILLRGKKSKALGFWLSAALSVISSVGATLYVLNDIEVKQSGSSIFASLGTSVNWTLVFYGALAIIAPLLGAWACSGWLKRYCR
jgi:hypothetical protein